MNTHTIDKIRNTFNLYRTYGNNDYIGESISQLEHVLQCPYNAELYYIIKSKKFKYILIINCCNQKIDNEDTPLRSRPLSCNFLPLKKYNAIKISNYYSKEISIIKI